MRTIGRGLVATAASVLVWVSVASAQEEPRVVADPPLLKILRPGAAKGVAAADVATPVAGEAVLDLNVVYTKSKLWNPAEQRYDVVNLRSYQGTDIDPNAPYVSPTIRVVPGDTVRVTLNNQLPADASCIAHGPGPESNTPHCFNGTNLHTHGLWVNPAGNGDNVLISINPGVSFQYEYKIAPDHPAGTFWYHTHRHGSTALQVSSGMAGALVIRGSRPPTAKATGDVDVLLRPTAEQPFTERLLVLQQIQYACRDADKKIKTNPDKTWRCDPGDVGGIEGYDQFLPGSWSDSGRYTSINGLVMPRFEGSKAGRVERWRMIHGGIDDAINLELRKLKPGAAAVGKMTAAASDEFVGANCTGDPVPLYAIAADGLTMAAAQKMSTLVFQGGYRWDALVVFPDAGTYCVVDAAAEAAATADQVDSSRQLLGFVRVGAGSKVPGDPTAYLTERLVAAAAKNIPNAVRSKVIAELRNGLELSSFVPHPDIEDGQVTGTQDIVFNIDISKMPPLFEVNGVPYDSTKFRKLTLGDVDEWTLKSDFVSHPFHIHINPFQVVRILDPSGKDVSALGAVDNASGTVDPQYPGLKGVWKDTLWVKSLVTPRNPSGGKYTVVVRTRYERYIGDFVLHCHILDHEDQGMMENVRIALPDGKGGAMEH